MENPGRNLRPRTVVAPARSPKKGPTTNKNNKGPANATKPSEKSKNDGGKGGKGGKATVAVGTAREYLDEESDSDLTEEEEILGSKRARNDGKLLVAQEEKQAAEAEMQATAWMETDMYALEIEKRRQDVQDNLLTYKAKANLAKGLQKGAKKTAKQAQLKKKLTSIRNKLASLDNLTQKRYDELFAGALKDIIETKRPEKKRRVEKEEPEVDGLEISEGKCPSIDFFEFSIAAPSFGDRP
jgi:hypothetical protein